jgi:hypothetical protein
MGCLQGAACDIEGEPNVAEFEPRSGLILELIQSRPGARATLTPDMASWSW